jgi:tetratricopeptide (TPR) repeat protein
LPEPQDMDRIEKMLEELGEKELDLGELPEGSYPEPSGKKKEAGPPTPPEEGPEPSGEEAGEEEFQELLKDISIGLTEEKELEERMAVPSEAELIPTEEISEQESEAPVPAGADEEVFASLEELLGEEPSAAAGEEPGETPPPAGEEEEAELEQPLPGTEGPETPEEEPFPTTPEETEEETGAIRAEDEEGLDLPIDFDLEDLLAEEGPPSTAEDVQKAGEEAAPEEWEPEPGEEMMTGAAEQGPAPSEEIGEEEEPSAPVEEPQPTEEEPPFDLEGLSFEEPEEPAAEPEEPSIPEELKVEPEIEEGIEAILSREEGAPAEEEVEKVAPEEVAPEEGAPKEGAPKEGETPAVPPAGEEVEGISFEDLEAIGLGEGEAEEKTGELPPAEGLIEEEPAPEEKPEPREVSGIDLVEEPAPGAFEGFEEAEGLPLPEVPEIEEEEAAGPAGAVMELGDDDIGQIKTKLSTLNPVLAATIQSIIVKGTLPADSMNGILELLIMDAPEQEITEYVERVIGRKIAAPPRRPAAPVVVRKPGVLGALAENLAPFLRVAMLFSLIAVVLGAIFWVYFYNPLRARKYYQEALEEVSMRNFEGARIRIEQAKKFQDKMPNFYRGVGQYDDLGWELMVAGQYPFAKEQFEEGIRREIDKGKRITNIRIFMRLAILDNLLGEYGGGEYGEAEEIYAFVLDDLDEVEETYPALVRNTQFYVNWGGTDGFGAAERLAERFDLNSTATYEIRMLRGENLIARYEDMVGEDAAAAQEILNRAYTQFQYAMQERKSRAAPIFKMIQIEMLRDNRRKVDELFGEVQRRFPKAVDEEVQTELAIYYTAVERFSPVRDLLLRVLRKQNVTYPYPPAYYAYAGYYHAVGDSTSQEDFLEAALVAEQNRVLPRDWNFRDRKLVSWTDAGVQKLKLRAGGGKDISSVEVGGVGEEDGLLFPWESRDYRLLSQVYNDLGEIYAQREGYEDAAQAILYYNRAIEQLNMLRSVRGEYAEPYFNLAQVYFYRSKDYELAKRYYLRFLDVARSRYNDEVLKDLNYNLGYIYYHEGLEERREYMKERKFNQALDRWSDLAMSMPDNPHVANAVGNTLLHLGAYEAALGEFLMLSEVYDGFVEMLGEIRPWSDQHKRIALEAAAVYNNLAVASYGIAEQAESPTQKAEYEKNALLALYKAGELADLMGAERGKIQYNIQKIIHPDIARAGMAIQDSLSSDYRFSLYNLTLSE